MVSTPRAVFLGTLSVITGDRVLVDVAEAAHPVIGAAILLFRPGAPSEGRLIAVAKLEAVRGATADLRITLASTGLPLQLQDTAYIVQ